MIGLVVSFWHTLANGIYPYGQKVQWHPQKHPYFWKNKRQGLCSLWALLLLDVAPRETAIVLFICEWPQNRTGTTTRQQNWAGRTLGRWHHGASIPCNSSQLNTVFSVFWNANLFNWQVPIEVQLSMAIIFMFEIPCGCAVVAGSEHYSPLLTAPPPTEHFLTKQWVLEQKEHSAFSLSKDPALTEGGKLLLIALASTFGLCMTSILSPCGSMWR